MQSVKEIIEQKADINRTDYLIELRDNLLSLIVNDEVTNEQLGTDIEHRIEELLKQIRFVKLKNDNRLWHIKEVGKYDEVTLESDTQTLSFNMEYNITDATVHTMHFDFLVDFISSIERIEWVEFTKLVTDKTLLKTENIKGILELMLV